MPISDAWLSWIQMAMAAVLGAVVSLVGVALTNRHARHLAERSGAFRRPKLGLSIFGINLHAGQNILAWCVRHPGPESTRALYKLPLAVVNEGDGRCEDVVLTLQGPAECFGNPEGLSAKATPAVFDDVIRRGQMDIGFLRQVSYRLSRIGARSAIGIDDVLMMSPSFAIKKTTRFTTKDDVAMTATFEVSFAYNLEWMLFSSDEPAVRITTPLYCIEGQATQDIARHFSKVVGKKISDYLANAGAWERFRFYVLRKGDIKRVMLIDYGEGNVTSVRGKTLHWFLDSEYSVRALNCVVPRMMPWR